MKVLDVGMLPVCHDDRMVGSITDRDIVIRAVAGSLDPKSARVRHIMTDEMIYCFEDQDVAEAARLMEDRQIRRVAVLDRQHRLVGILSVSDLAVRTRGAFAAHVLERISMPAMLIDQ